jgi:predicted nucleic acid-binding protein
LVFIVDTNILFSFFRDNPVRQVILNQDLLGIRLVTPGFSTDELRNNKDALIKYSKLSETEIESLINLMESFVEIMPMGFFQEFKDEGIKVSPDPKDAPFFALALKLKGSIWSNEPRLKRQSKVRVLSTRDLLKELGIDER